jgi:hypothetical protein
MFCNWKKGEYHPSKALKAFQIFLLILIIIGVTLLFTQKIWVPKIVGYIMKNDTSYVLVPPAATTTSPTSSTTAPVARPGKVDTGVEGIVTIGPTCPVVRYPDDGTCADKPYQTTLMLASTLPGKGGGVLVHTDAKGYFSQELTPGTYTIRAQSDGMLPRLSPITFTVTSHKRVSLNLQFDSGIR